MRIDIDYLKANKSEIYYFGLGFIQVKFGKEERMHFYHPELPPFVDTPHDHRYDFISKVITGQIENSIYEMDTNGNGYRLVLDTCNANERIENPIIEASCGIKLMDTFTTSDGSEYYMPMDAFHTVKVIPNTITYLRRGEIKKEHARVFKKQDEENLCPFSKTIPENELWEYIADMIG
jgi:hypothetical protein